jgi:uncharacterized membrane protein YkoI
MKSKKMMALALVAVLTISAYGTYVIAADSADDAGSSAISNEQTAGTEEKGCFRGRHGGREKVAEPENAIGKDKAKAAALAEAGVTEEEAGKVKARVSQLDDGTVVYRVSFSLDGQKYTIKINALTGEVADKSVKEITEEEEAAKEHRGHRRPANCQNAGTTDGTDGSTDAKVKAKASKDSSETGQAFPSRQGKGRTKAAAETGAEVSGESV